MNQPFDVGHSAAAPDNFSISPAVQSSVTVVIPWKNRPTLLTTMEQNAPIFRNNNMQIVIVNCGGDPTTLLESLRNSHLPIDLVYLPAEPFNRSLAINIGASLAVSDSLLVLDADIILTPDCVGRCLDALNGDHVVTIGRLRESVPRRTEAMSCSDHLRDLVLVHSVHVQWSDGQSSVAESYREYLDGSHGGQGQVFVRRKHLLAIDGYNSELLYWGFEDVDVLIRLSRSLGLSHKQAGEALHLSHGDEARELGGISRWESNRLNAARACNRYDHGALNGTLSADVGRWIRNTTTMSFNRQPTELK